MKSKQRRYLPAYLPNRPGVNGSFTQWCPDQSLVPTDINFVKTSDLRQLHDGSDYRSFPQGFKSVKEKMHDYAYGASKLILRPSVPEESDEAWLKTQLVSNL